MASLIPGIIGGGISLLGGLFGGSSTPEMSPEQRRLLDEALKQTRSIFGQTAPLRELGVERLQEPIAPRPDISAAFMDPGNPFNRVPLPAALNKSPVAQMPGARNPVLPAVRQQTNQPGVMPLLPAPGATPPPTPPTTPPPTGSSEPQGGKTMVALMQQRGYRWDPSLRGGQGWWTK